MAKHDFTALAIAARDAHGTPAFTARFNALWVATAGFVKASTRQILGLSVSDETADVVDEISWRFFKRIRESIAEFDESKGAFTTWATWQVKGVISNYLTDARRQMRSPAGGMVSLDSLLEGGFDMEDTSGDPARAYEAVSELRRVAEVLSPEEMDVLLRDAGAV